MACGGTRDVVPETHDVHEVTPAGPADQNASYAYVARRPLGIVGLAEARGIASDLAARAVDHLADALDVCATDLGKQGKLVDGAARVVAMFGADGAVSGLNVKLAPGAAVEANALLCLITPLKLTMFDVGDGGSRGFAIEAAWGPHVAASGPGSTPTPSHS